MIIKNLELAHALIDKRMRLF